MPVHDHEVVSIYGFSKDQIHRLLEDASECVLMWATQDGWPVGVVHAFVWQHERVWLTFAAHRHRAAAIRRDPRVSVAVSGTAGVSDDCPNGAVTLKGRATFHEDQATKDWFYRALAKKVSPNSKAGEERFFSILDSPLRVILEIAPEKWITFDGAKSARDMAGKLADSDKTPPHSADAERMNAERRRRGLAPREV
jgi:general stress protein 26